jgi:hypothetical protein
VPLPRVAQIHGRRRKQRVELRVRAIAAGV